MSPQTRMLFLSPAFFGYEIDIKDALERRNVEVDYFDERPSNSTFARAFFRTAGSRAEPLVRRYYRRILDETQGRSYDYLLIIKGEIVPLWFVSAMRQRNPSARFVYYSFDAIPGGSNCTLLFPEMDYLYSFDPNDVAANDRLALKPLFYSQDFSAPEIADERPHQIAFVGTLHSDRYQFVTRLFESFDRTFGFFYVPARWFFAANKYLSGHFRAVQWSEVSFNKLSKGQVAEIFRNSAAILDIQRSQQSGLTMRTFEVLASGAVLVTGNTSVLDADFYDPARIVVMDDYDSPGASQRLHDLLADLPKPVGMPNGFDRYSIDSWVLDFIQ